MGGLSGRGGADVTYDPAAEARKLVKVEVRSNGHRPMYKVVVDDIVEGMETHRDWSAKQDADGLVADLTAALQAAFDAGRATADTVPCPGIKPDRAELLEILKEESPEALLADGFEGAFAGICRRFGQPPLAAYDLDKVLETLTLRDGLSEEEAVEHFDYNIIGAWVGEHTPVFVQLADGGSAEPSSVT
jgi:hypothetical protein